MADRLDDLEVIASLVGKPGPAVPPLPQSPASGLSTSLSPDQVAALLEAQKSVTKVRRAVSVATFDGWMTATFAGLTILTGFLSPSALMLGTGMAAVAFVEFRGAGQLRRLAPNAAKTLGINQLALAGLLILYSCWQMYASRTSPSELSQAVGNDPQLTQMIGGIDDLTKMITSAVYGVLILIAIFVQGGTALYYFSRQRYLDAHLKRTPKWVADLQRAGVAV